ncbi:MAG: VWA domain-containing protein [Myxococcota bacterium]
MSELNWGGPLWVLLALVPVVIYLMWSLHNRSLILHQIRLKTAIRWHRWRVTLLILTALGALLAYARPQFGKERQTVEKSHRDIVVLLDVSRSMLAEDIKPSRMAQAQRELQDLSSLLNGDRVALVLFAGGAFARMPLTTDYAVFNKLVMDSSPDILRAQGSDIGAAIQKGLTLFDSEASASRAMLILSDGEEHSPQVEAVAKNAAEQGVNIFAMGIGTEEGAPIPNLNSRDGGFLTDKSGSVVLSRLNSSALKGAASVASGAYVQSTSGIQDMRQLLEEGIYAKLDAQKGADKDVEIWNEYYQWPLGVAMMAFLLSFARFNRSGVTVLAFLLLTMPAKANDLLAAHIANPSDLNLAERAAVSLLQSGQTHQAYQLLEDVANHSMDPEQRTRSRYNAGLAAYRQGALQDAVKAWEQVLEEEAEHEAAQKNVAAVKQEIAQRLAEDQSRQQESQSEDSEPQESEDDGSQTSDSQETQDSESQSSQETESQSSDSSEESQSDAQAQADSEENTDESPESKAPQDSQTDAEPQEQGNPTGESEALSEGEMEAPSSEDLSQEGLSLDDLSDMGATAEPTDMSELQSSPLDMRLQEAERTVDSVEEGRPNVVVGARSSEDKQW